MYREVLSVAAAVALCMALSGCSSSNTTDSAGGEGTNVQLTTTDGASSTTTGANVEVVDQSYVKENPDGATIIDVRTTEEFNAGHIPGAVNVEYSTSPCTGSTVAQDQMDAYSAAGFSTDSALVLYCRTGVRATAAAEILQQAGFTNVRVYQGSWSEWSSDSSNPIEY